MGFFWGSFGVLFGAKMNPNLGFIWGSFGFFFPGLGFIWGSFGVRGVLLGFFLGFFVGLFFGNSDSLGDQYVAILAYIF